MALLLEHSVFLRVMKTGSQWTELAIENAGLIRRHIAGNHGGLKKVRDALTTEGMEDKYLLMMVRNPVTWHVSRWSSEIHRRRLRRGVWLNVANRKTDATEPGEKKNFDLWMNRIITDFPGHFTNVLRSFAGQSFNGVDFVGKQENLTNDLISMLKKAGESFNPSDIRNTERINEGNNGLKEIAKYKRQTLRKLIESDKVIFDRFGYSTKVSDYEEYLL